MIGDASLLATLQRLEEQLLSASVRRSREAISALLAEDFVEFGSSGQVFDRDAIINAVLSEAAPAHITASGFMMVAATPELAVSRYRASVFDPTGERRLSLRSSVWAQTGGTWRLCFHQGTRAAPAP